MSKVNRKKMDMTLGLSSEHDRNLSDAFSALADKRTFEEIVQAFPAYIRRMHITRFLAYYELFKKIETVPGWIVECGIYRGFSLFALAKFLEIFCMGDKTRKVLGFDNFSGFTELHKEDGPEDRSVTRNKGGTNPGNFRNDFLKLLELNNQDAFAPWARRISVVEGNVQETVPIYCAENPGLRISLLHLDIDTYEPVCTCIEHLYPRVVPGGIVVLDEFAHKDWPGESKAVEDIFLRNGWKTPNLRTFPWVGTPTTYFIKEGFSL
jgi:hypothetical protein